MACVVKLSDYFTSFMPSVNELSATTFARTAPPAWISNWLLSRADRCSFTRKDPTFSEPDLFVIDLKIAFGFVSDYRANSVRICLEGES